MANNPAGGQAPGVAAPPANYIKRVAPWMKATRSTAYEPQVVSLGPFHHGRQELLPMEEYKREAMTRMANRAGRPVQAFIDATQLVADELEGAYVGLDESWRGLNRWRFVLVMATDGCFLLEMALRVLNAMPGAPARGLENDPRDTKALFMWESIRKDVVAIENQLPLRLLRQLEQVRRPGANVTDLFINRLVLSFFQPPDGWMHQVREDRLGLHPLEILHISFCENLNGENPVAPKNQQLHNTMSPAEQLRQKGIVFEKSTTRKLYDIAFIRRCCKRPVLHMPEFRVRNDTERCLLNLVAFEELHDGARHVMSPYLCFMNNIIDTGADVALLRSAGVIVHTLGSDQAVADLFNTVYSGPLSPYSRLHTVQREVTEHCEKQCNWAECWGKFLRNYWSDPVVRASFIVAIFLASLAAIQTGYAIASYHYPKK